MLDGILVQHLASIPGVAALCQQVSQSLIVHLNEGSLHGILPPGLLQLVCCLQNLKTGGLIFTSHNKTVTHASYMVHFGIIPPSLLELVCGLQNLKTRRVELHTRQQDCDIPCAAHLLTPEPEYSRRITLHAMLLQLTCSIQNAEIGRSLLQQLFAASTIGVQTCSIS